VRADARQVRRPSLTGADGCICGRSWKLTLVIMGCAPFFAISLGVLIFLISSTEKVSNFTRRDTSSPPPSAAQSVGNARVCPPSGVRTPAINSISFQSFFPTGRLFSERAAAQASVAAYSRAGDVATEVYSMIRTVAATGGERHEVSRYDTFLAAAEKAGIRKGFGLGFSACHPPTRPAPRSPRASLRRTNARARSG
jgi:hypothetical protein